MKKKTIILLLVSLTMIISSCDPDVAGEGINLPSMEFAFKVSPDTAYMKLGDTLTLYASLSSTIENNVILNDGNGEIFTYISRGDSIPIKNDSDIKTAMIDNDYKLIIVSGGVKSIDNDIIRFTANPTGDSIIMCYKFIFLKKGLFRFGSFQASFYEGSKGKTRWNAHFDVDNPNWDRFWAIDGQPAPNPNEDHYKRNYFVAVTE